MAQQSRINIKKYFQTGDIPTQQEYAHLVDSYVTLTNDTNSGSLILTGSFKATEAIIEIITASGDISSSGTIHASSISASGGVLVSGDSIFGEIAPTSIVNVNTIHITASGNISSSGNIIGDNLNIVTGSFDLIENINTNQITSSGIISSSGNITASGLYSSGDILLGDNGSIIGVDSLGNANNTIVSTNLDNSISMGYAGLSFFRFYGNELSINSDYLIGKTLVGGAGTTILGNNGGVIYASGSVTASYGISSSGTVLGNEVVSSGHITSSGNLILKDYTGNSGGTGSFGSLILDGASVDFTGLPTSDPGVSGRLWNSGSIMKISAG